LTYLQLDLKYIDMDFPNNFTPRAVEAMNLSQKEAIKMNLSYMGTEHLLLGIIKLNQGIASSVLKKLGADFEFIRTTKTITN